MENLFLASILSKFYRSLVNVHLKLGKTYSKHVNLSILNKFYRSLVKVHFKQGKTYFKHQSLVNYIDH